MRLLQSLLSVAGGAVFCLKSNTSKVQPDSWCIDIQNQHYLDTAALCSLTLSQHVLNFSITPSSLHVIQPTKDYGCARCAHTNVYTSRALMTNQGGGGREGALTFLGC